MIRDDQYAEIMKQAIARENAKPKLALFKIELDYGPDKPKSYAFFACTDIEKVPTLFERNRGWFKNPVGFSVADIRYLHGLSLADYERELAFADVREDL